MAADEDEAVSGLLSVLNKDEYDPQILNQALALLKMAKKSSTTTTMTKSTIAGAVASTSMNDVHHKRPESTESYSASPVESTIKGSYIASESFVEPTASEGDVTDDEPTRIRTDPRSVVQVRFSPSSSVIELASSQTDECSTFIDFETVSNMPPTLKGDNAADSQTDDIKSLVGDGTLSEACASTTDLRSNTPPCQSTRTEDSTSGDWRLIDSWSVEDQTGKEDDEDDYIESSQVSVAGSTESACPIDSEISADPTPSTSSSSQIQLTCTLGFPQIVLHRLAPGNYLVNSKPCPASKKMRLSGVNHKRDVLEVLDVDRHASSKADKEGPRHTDSLSSSKEKLAPRDKRRINVSQTLINKRRMKFAKPRRILDSSDDGEASNVLKKEINRVIRNFVLDDDESSAPSTPQPMEIVVKNKTIKEDAEVEKPFIKIGPSITGHESQSLLRVSQPSRKRSNSFVNCTSGRSSSGQRKHRSLSLGDRPKNSNSVQLVESTLKLEESNLVEESELQVEMLEMDVSDSQGCGTPLEDTILPQMDVVMASPCEDDPIVVEVTVVSEPTNSSLDVSTEDIKSVAVIDPITESPKKPSFSKHKKKKHHHHQHHHHHHSRHGRDNDELKRHVDATRSNVDKGGNNSFKRSNFVNGFVTSAEKPTSTVSTPVSTDKVLKLQDDKLRLDSCFVRLERLHPAVEKRLAKYRYVRMASRGPKVGLKVDSSSMSSLVGPTKPQPPKQSVVEALDTFEQRRERRQEQLRRREKEREQMRKRLSTAKVPVRKSPSPERSTTNRLKRRRIIKLTDSSDGEETGVVSTKSFRPNTQSSQPQSSKASKPLSDPPFKLSKDKVETLNVVAASTAKTPSTSTPLVVLPSTAMTDHIGGIVDVYGSFDVDVAKDALQVDDFLMSGNNGLDMPVASFAGDDDVLVKARQVGQLGDDVATFDVDEWPVDTMSSWDTDGLKSAADGKNNNNNCADNARIVEDNLNEYEMYLDDCDLLGEMSPGKVAFGKISGPISDDLYNTQSRKQGTEELQVQINGTINPSFVNHSPVKLSPHNVMLSSYVCDVSTTKEDAAATSTSNVLELSMALCPSGDSQKSNMAAAPFAMTTDLDVTPVAVATPRVTLVELKSDIEEAPSSGSIQGQADSAHSTANVGPKEESVTHDPPVQFAWRFRQSKLPSDPAAVEDTELVWRFGQPPPERPKPRPPVPSVVVAAATKQAGDVKGADKSGAAFPNGINQQNMRSKQRDSLAIRIAKELGTRVPSDESLKIIPDTDKDLRIPDSDEDLRILPIHDGDALSLLAPESFQDSMFSRASSSHKISAANEGVMISEIAQTKARPLWSAVNMPIEQLEVMANPELERMFEQDIADGECMAAMNVFNVLQSHVEDKLRFLMLEHLIRIGKQSLLALEPDFVEQLLTAVVESATYLVKLPLQKQIRVLMAMFSLINKCQRPFAHATAQEQQQLPLHNFTRTGGPKYGSDLIKPPLTIGEIFNNVLRAAIDYKVSELPQFYKEAHTVGIDIDESSVRALLILFRSSQVDTLAKDLYKIGCCMGVYPRVKIRPTWIKLKSYYAENEMDVILRCFISRMASKLRSDSGRSRAKIEALKIIISIEVLPCPGVLTPLSSATPSPSTVITTSIVMLTKIDYSLSAALSRLNSVIANLLDNKLSNQVLERDKGRLVMIGPKATSYLMSKALFGVQPKRESEDSCLTSSEDDQRTQATKH